MKRKSITIPINSSVASSQSLDIDLDRAGAVSVQVTYSNDAPSAAAVAIANVDATENTFTKTNHGFVVGVKGQFTTSDADLPNGLNTSTDYFIIKVDDDTFKVATSLANAVAGTAVNFSDVGTGTHTFTPATSAGNVCKLQSSNDGINFADLGSYTVTISTSAATQMWNVGSLAARYLRINYAPSAGQISLKVVVSQQPL